MPAPGPPTPGDGAAWLISRRVGPLLLPISTIDVAVVVDVAERRAAADLRQRERRARACADVLEPAAAEVAEQQLPLVQRERIARLPQRLDDLHRAVDRDQIEPAVVVEVEPARPEPGERQAGRTDRRRSARDPSNTPVPSLT